MEGGWWGSFVVRAALDAIGGGFEGFFFELADGEPLGMSGDAADDGAGGLGGGAAEVGFES